MKRFTWPFDTNKSPKKEKPYEFILIPPDNHPKYKEVMSYNFERKTLWGREPNLPTLNFNSPGWMPGIIPPDEKYAARNDENGFKRRFMARMNARQDEELKQLWQPKPQKFRPCQVCDKPFDDYIEHIKSQEHLNNLQANPALAEFIAESEGTLEQFMSDLRKEFPPQPKSNVPPLFSEETNLQQRIVNPNSNLNCKFSIEKEY